MIRIKRIYEAVAADDGARFLVDRLWPRGVRKETLALAGWLRSIAPSTELRNWYGHQPERWQEFCRRYEGELEEKSADWQPLCAASVRGTVTLLFAAHDTEHNNAVALKAYLEKKLTEKNAITNGGSVQSS